METGYKLPANERKRVLARSVIVALGGATKVVRHDLPSLWGRHGELILSIMKQTALKELLEINETAEPGELEDLIQLVPKDADNDQRELFFASMTVAAEVFRQIQQVQVSPPTIQGPAPAPQPLAPIAAIGPVHAASLPAPAPVQEPEPSPPRVVDQVQVRKIPAAYQRVDGNFLTVAFESNASWSQKLATLKESLHSLLRWLILILPMLAVLCLIVWHGIAFMAWLMRTTGPAPGFALSLVLFACVAGINWWLWMKYSDRLIAWAKQPKEHPQPTEDEGD